MGLNGHPIQPLFNDTANARRNFVLAMSKSCDSPNDLSEREGFMTSLCKQNLHVTDRRAHQGLESGTIDRDTEMMIHSIQFELKIEEKEKSLCFYFLMIERFCFLE